MKVMAAALSGREMPDQLSPTKKYFRPEYLEEAMYEVNKLLASKFDDVPESVSDDLRVQEIIRGQLDEVITSLVLKMRHALDGRTKRE